MKLLQSLDIFAELIHLIYQLGLLTRQYLVPAVVYVYVVFDYYITPAFTIPYYYEQVRQERLSM